MEQRNIPSIREVLDSAANAIKRGDIAQGKERLQWVLEKDSENVLAWLWMSRCVKGADAKLKCFHRVLAIDPTNEHALNGIQIISAPTRRPKETSAAEKHGDPPSVDGPRQATAKRRRVPLILFGTLASITFFICGFFIISRLSDTSNGDTFAPEPSFSEMVLGQDGNRVREILNGKGYSFEWSTDVGGYIDIALKTENAGLAFVLFESGGQIDKVLVAVSEPALIKWESTTDRFFDDCNLPAPVEGGMRNLHRYHGDELSIITGSGRVTVYPVPGLKVKIESLYENWTSTTLLTYSLSN
jgi:hypothetical protein